MKISERSKAVGARISIVLTLAVLTGCGGAKPYKAMADAAQSEEAPLAQARDKRLKLELRRALVEHVLLKGLTITPYVYQDQAVLVGSVDTEEQKDAVLSVARGMGAFRSVESYLPVVTGKEPESSFTADASITANIKARLVVDPEIVASRVDVKTIGGHVVLVGVVSPREKNRILELVEAVPGVKGVTDFLVPPDPDYERRRRGLR